MKKTRKKPISIASRKQKARNLQSYIAEEVRKAIQLESVTDVKPALMGETGFDLKLSKLAKRRFPFGVEAKNQESLSIHSVLKKLSEDVATANEKLPKKKRYRCGLLVFKRNHSETYAVLPFDKFLKIWERYLVCVREVEDKRAENCPTCLKQKINGSVATLSGIVPQYDRE